MGSLWAAVPVACATMTSLTACNSLIDDPAASCRQAETQTIAGLRPVALGAMRNTGADWKTYSGCEDTGESRPSVIAEVTTWKHAAAAEKHLAALSWTRESSRSYVSPDGGTSAQIIMDVGDRPHALIYFAKAG